MQVHVTHSKINGLIRSTKTQKARTREKRRRGTHARTHTHALLAAAAEQRPCNSKRCHGCRGDTAAPGIKPSCGAGAAGTQCRHGCSYDSQGRDAFDGCGTTWSSACGETSFFLLPPLLSCLLFYPLTLTMPLLLLFCMVRCGSFYVLALTSMQSRTSLPTRPQHCILPAKQIELTWSISCCRLVRALTHDSPQVGTLSAPGTAGHPCFIWPHLLSSHLCLSACLPVCLPVCLSVCLCASHRCQQRSRRRPAHERARAAAPPRSGCRGELPGR